MSFRTTIGTVKERSAIRYKPVGHTSAVEYDTSDPKLVLWKWIRRRGRPISDMSRLHRTYNKDDIQLGVVCDQVSSIVRAYRVRSSITVQKCQ